MTHSLGRVIRDTQGDLLAICTCGDRECPAAWNEVPCTQGNVPLTCDDALPGAGGVQVGAPFGHSSKVHMHSSECPNPAPTCTPAAPEGGSDV